MTLHVVSRETKSYFYVNIGYLFAEEFIYISNHSRQNLSSFVSSLLSKFFIGVLFKTKDIDVIFR